LKQQKYRRSEILMSWWNNLKSDNQFRIALSPIKHNELAREMSMGGGRDDGLVEVAVLSTAVHLLAAGNGARRPTEPMHLLVLKDPAKRRAYNDHTLLAQLRPLLHEVCTTNNKLPLYTLTPRIPWTIYRFF